MIRMFLFSKFLVATLATLALTSCFRMDKDEALDVYSNPNASLLKPIASSGYNTCAISQSGQVKCWGANPSGDLGQGDTANRGDDPNEMGSHLPAIDLGTGRTAKSVAVGAAHVCVLLDNDKVKCWGLNDQGQLGQGDTVNRGDDPSEMGDNLPYVDLGTGRTAKAIAVGNRHSCAILDNSKLKCWGYDDDGQLGDEQNHSRGDGPNEMGDNLPYVDLGTGRTVKSIAVGTSNTCGVLDNDKVKCWGHNGFGQLGVGHTSGVGQNPGDMGDNLPYLDLGTGRTVKTIVAASYAFCAVLDNYKLKCWGLNDHGQLGLGDTANRGDDSNEMGDNLPYVDVGTSMKVSAVSFHFSHVCTTLQNHRTKCWGANQYGQLGLGDANDRGDSSGEMGDNLPYVDLGTGHNSYALSVGLSHTCSIQEDYTVKCWGMGNWGLLGQGNTNFYGDGPNQMGDNLPTVDLGF